MIEALNLAWRINKPLFFLASTSIVFLSIGFVASIMALAKSLNWIN